MENFDDMTKTKLMILWGDFPIDGRTRDGEIDKIYPLNDDQNEDHTVSLRRYLETHLKDNHYVQRCAKEFKISGMIDGISRLGGIIFREHTLKNYSDNSIIVYCSKRDITMKQKETLKNIRDALLKQNYEVRRVYDFKINDSGYARSMLFDKGDGSILDKWINPRETEEIDDDLLL